jgi:gamma-glutamyltranspeptidase/glutathione hydrolase
MSLLDFGLSPQQAGEQPRIAHLGGSSPWSAPVEDGGTVVFERGIDDRTKQMLMDMGHVIGTEQQAFGGYQAIWRSADPLVYFGASDPRKDGCAAGY